jgi:L-threonylcarbamoyladenylate synthase
MACAEHRDAGRLTVVERRCHFVPDLGQVRSNRGYPRIPVRPATLRHHLSHGGVVAFATASCFGLSCDPRSARGLARVLHLKRRPRGKGLILIADRASRLRPYVSGLSDRDWEVLQTDWPGPYTWLVPSAGRTLSAVRGHHTQVAIRVDAHPPAVSVLSAARRALVSTSANRSGRRPIASYRECVRQFGHQAWVLRGRVGAHRYPSTIREFRGGRLIRG